jgi:hypothetical protein
MKPFVAATLAARRNISYWKQAPLAAVVIEFIRPFVAATLAAQPLAEREGFEPSRGG